MSATNVISRQIKDGTVSKVDLNTTVSGSAVITKLAANNGVAITSSTGVDPGTGDVTIAADLSYLDTKYPSLTASRTQNYVLAAPSSGSGAASFRALVAGDIPTIAIGGVSGLQGLLDDKLTASGTGGTNYLPKYAGSRILGYSQIYDSGTGVGIGALPAYGYKLNVDGGAKSTYITLGESIYYALDLGMGPALSNYAQISTGANTLRHLVTSDFTWSTFVGGLTFAQRMKLNATGLKVGTGDPAYNLDVAGDIGFTGALYVNGSGSMSSGSDGQFLKKTTVSSNPVNIWSNIGISDVTSLQTTLDAKYGGTLTSGYLPVANGTFTLIDSPIYNSGNYTGIGTTTVSGYNLRILRDFSTTTGYGISVEGTAQTGTTTVNNFQSLVSTASGVTPTTVRHFYANQGTFTGTPTNQYGFFVSNTLTGATNNFGFYSNIAAATGAWNFYSIGTANNYFNGKLGIGTTTLTSANINITLPLTGAANYYGIMNSGQVQSDVSVAVGFRSNIGNASGATTADLIHFGAYRGTISGTVTRQYGFYVDSTMSTSTTGVTNYGVFSALSSGTNMWNIYSGGTANNYFNGNVWIGLASSSYKFDVNGTSHFSGNATFDSNVIIATAPSLASHATNKAYVDSLSFVKRGDTVRTIAFTDITRSGTQTINGVSLSIGDLVLLAGQTTASQNGVYVVASGSWTRSTTNDSDTEIRGAYHLVTAGTYANQRYINTNASTITVDTTSITYSLDFGSEIDPVWASFRDGNDITSTRIGQWNTAYSERISTKTTNDLTEGSTNKYFTEARVQSSILSNYNITGVSNTAIISADSVVGAFQKTQVQLNNKLTIGGNTFGAAVAAGTNDAFDFTLKRNGTTQLSLKSTGVEFGADINLLTGNKIKLSGSSGVDHQFIKYDGTNNVWAYLNTGELSDKDDIVMLQNIAGERGFQMYSDSAKTYADAFIFTNTVAGVALGIHGYANDDSDTVKEFGLQLAADGLLYHKKLDGTRKQIATVDMITGGTTISVDGSTLYRGLNYQTTANSFSKSTYSYANYSQIGEMYMGFSPFSSSPYVWTAGISMNIVTLNETSMNVGTLGSGRLSLYGNFVQINDVDLGFIKASSLNTVSGARCVVRVTPLGAGYRLTLEQE